MILRDERKNLKLFNELALALIGRGFTVYTDSINENQPLLPGTRKLDCSIFELFSICRKLKVAVSIDTGLSDALIVSGCNLILINPTDSDNKKLLAKICNYTNYFELSTDDEDVLEKSIERIFLFDSINNPLLQIVILQKDAWYLMQNEQYRGEPNS